MGTRRSSRERSRGCVRSRASSTSTGSRPAADRLRELKGTVINPKARDRAILALVALALLGSLGYLLVQAIGGARLQALRGGDEPMFGFGSFASTDSLTLLRSHSAFRERLDAEVELAGLGEGKHELALIVVRAFNLDQLNRELGYGAVDRLIQALARQVERAAVDCGGLAGRDGGARLAIVAPGVGRDAAIMHAEGIRERAPKALQITCSTSIWSEGDSATTLLESASAQVGL